MLSLEFSPFPKLQKSRLFQLFQERIQSNVVIIGVRIVVQTTGDGDELFGVVGSLEEVAAQLIRHDFVGITVRDKQRPLMLLDEFDGIQFLSFHQPR